jgi:hypothetical protein
MSGMDRLANSNDALWKQSTLFLLGLVVALGVVWFTHVKDAATKDDVSSIKADIIGLRVDVAKITTRLDEAEKRRK